MGFGYWFGMNWEGFSSEKTQEKTQNSGSAKACRDTGFSCRGEGASGCWVPRHKDVVPRHKAKFRASFLGNFRPLLRGFGGCLRGVVLRF